MSQVKKLKENNNIDIIDIIKIVLNSEKTKYIDLFLRIINHNKSKETYKKELIKYILEKYGHLNRETIERLDFFQLMVLKLLFIDNLEPEQMEKFRLFCEYNERNLIPNNDLSKINSFEQVIELFDIADIRVNEKKLENEIIKIYEDDEFLVIKPLTFNSSKKYGSNTKWCTTSYENPEHFIRYSSNGILIYVINRLTGLKVACYKSLDKNNPELSFWNQTDIRIDSLMSELPDNILNVIKTHLSDKKILPNLKYAKDTYDVDNFRKERHINELNNQVSMRTTLRSRIRLNYEDNDIDSGTLYDNELMVSDDNLIYEDGD